MTPESVRSARSPRAVFLYRFQVLDQEGNEPARPSPSSGHGTPWRLGERKNMTSITPQLLEAARAEAQAEALIANYDLCMVKADASEAARKLDANHTEVYCAYLSQADAKCRRASKCDRLETLTDFRCRYASAAVESCRAIEVMFFRSPSLQGASMPTRWRSVRGSFPSWSST